LLPRWLSPDLLEQRLKLGLEHIFVSTFARCRPTRPD